MPKPTIARLVTVLSLLGANAAHAGDCAVTMSGPPARLLQAETIDWTFVIASGQTCLRGLRSGAMLLESVSLIAPAKIGSAAVEGYGFSYRAPADYKGDDAFSLRVVGTDRGIHGVSTINVRVSVR